MPSTRNQSPQGTGRLTRSSSPREPPVVNPKSKMKNRQSSPRGVEKIDSRTNSVKGNSKINSPRAAEKIDSKISSPSLKEKEKITESKPGSSKKDIESRSNIKSSDEKVVIKSVGVNKTRWTRQTSQDRPVRESRPSRQTKEEKSKKESEIRSTRQSRQEKLVEENKVQLTRQSRQNRGTKDHEIQSTKQRSKDKSEEESNIQSIKKSQEVTSVGEKSKKQQKSTSKQNEESDGLSHRVSRSTVSDVSKPEHQESGRDEGQPMKSNRRSIRRSVDTKELAQSDLEPVSVNQLNVRSSTKEKERSTKDETPEDSNPKSSAEESNSMSKTNEYRRIDSADTEQKGVEETDLQQKDGLNICDTSSNLDNATAATTTRSQDNISVPVNKTEDSKNITTKRGQKRSIGNTCSELQSTESKRLKTISDKNSEESKDSVDNEKREVVSTPLVDTFSPRRSSRGVVPNRRFKDMEMDFTPGGKRRQSVDDTTKSTPSDSKKKTEKLKPREKRPKAVPVAITPQPKNVSDGETDHWPAVPAVQQEVVMETVAEETRWIEEEVVKADRELTVEYMEESPAVTTEAVTESPQGSEDSNTKGEIQGERKAETTTEEVVSSKDTAEEFITAENVEQITLQAMQILMKDSALIKEKSSTGVKTLLETENTTTASSEEVKSAAPQVPDSTDVNPAMDTSNLDTAVIEMIGSDSAVKETVGRDTASIEAISSDTAVVESVGGEMEGDSVLMEVETTVEEENQKVDNPVSDTENTSTEVPSGEVIHCEEAIKDLGEYKLVRLEDMVQEFAGSAKASELTATPVTNIEKDVDEEIIRKILMSSKTFKNNNEIQIQIIRGEDYEVEQNKIADAKEAVDKQKVITMKVPLKNNMSTMGTQTPIITSRVADLPGKDKKSSLSAPLIKTIRVNIQQPEGTGTEGKDEVEEGKPQEFVIVHLPEGTKVTRPQVKEDKIEEAVPFNQSADGMFICGVCSYSTPKKANWYKHKKKHMAQKPHCCTRCGYRAATSSNLKRHMAIHDDIRDYQCHICMTTFRQKIHLERHIKYRHEEKRIKCPLCDYVCANENPDLKIHIKRRHLPQDSPDGTLRAFTCEECGVMAVNRKDLKQHMKFHRKGPELKLYCEHCSFVTDCESRLRRHMFIHTNEKPFHCGLCEYRGTQKEHVLRHMKSQHNIEVQKKVRSSDEASVDGSTDSRDVLIEKKPYRTDYSSQEKIFACNHCSMKFSKLLNLYKHLHAQHRNILPEQGEDEYLCVVCDFRTGSKKNLLVHMRKHNVQDQNPPSHVYSCVLCRYMNPKRRNLFQHMKKKHNIEIVMKDDGSTSCFLTDNCSSVVGKDESMQNILTVADIVTATTEDSQLQIVMDESEKNDVHLQNVISIEDIANCVSNPQPNNSNIIILEQGQTNTLVQHEAAEAIEGLQALAEQPGILESQEVISEPETQNLTVEEIQTTSKVFPENVMETEIVTMETDVVRTSLQENNDDSGKEKDTESNIQLSADQIMNLSSGDYVEINGEMYKVEISADEGHGGEVREVVQREEVAYNQTTPIESEQQVAVSDEHTFQEFVQLMTESTEENTSTAAHIGNDNQSNGGLVFAENQADKTSFQILSTENTSVDNSSSTILKTESDSLAVLAEITNAVSEVPVGEGYITIAAGKSDGDHTEPTNVMTVVNAANVGDSSATGPM